MTAHLLLTPWTDECVCLKTGGELRLGVVV